MAVSIYLLVCMLLGIWPDNYKMSEKLTDVPLNHGLMMDHHNIMETCLARLYSTVPHLDLTGIIRLETVISLGCQGPRVPEEKVKATCFENTAIIPDINWQLAQYLY